MKISQQLLTQQFLGRLRALFEISKQSCEALSNHESLEIVHEKDCDGFVQSTIQKLVLEWQAYR
jgi:hypothetical protein